MHVPSPARVPSGFSRGARGATGTQCARERGTPRTVRLRGESGAFAGGRLRSRCQTGRRSGTRDHHAPQMQRRPMVRRDKGRNANVDAGGSHGHAASATQTKVPIASHRHLHGRKSVLPTRRAVIEREARHARPECAVSRGPAIRARRRPRPHSISGFAMTLRTRAPRRVLGQGPANATTPGQEPTLDVVSKSGGKRKTDPTRRGSIGDLAEGC